MHLFHGYLCAPLDIRHSLKRHARSSKNVPRVVEAFGLEGVVAEDLVEGAREGAVVLVAEVSEAVAHVVASNYTHMQ